MTKKRLFRSAKALDARIARYFKQTEGRRATEKREKTTTARKTNSTEEKIELHQPEFPTFNGLTLYLGLVSLDEYAEYENKPRFSTPLKRARLRMAAIYEKKLHTHSYGGAAVALKFIMGDKQNHSAPETEDNMPPKVEIIHSGIVPAASEKEVIL